MRLVAFLHNKWWWRWR